MPALTQLLLLQYHEMAVHEAVMPAVWAELCQLYGLHLDISIYDLQQNQNIYDFSSITN